MFFTAVCIILILHFIVALPTVMRDELAVTERRGGDFTRMRR